MKHNHTTHTTVNYTQRFIVCLLLTIPLFIVAPMASHSALLSPTHKLLAGILSTIIYIYGGMPFLQGFWQELRYKRPGMMTLVAIAITVAYSYSIATLFVIPGMNFFGELATLIDTMLLGHWLEARSIHHTLRVIESLVHTLPARAHYILKDDIIQNIPREQLKKGDRVLVLPGEKIPADGIVYEGTSEVNEAAITGESRPVVKTKGSSVIGGSINSEGALKLRISKDQKEQYINQLAQLVQRIMHSKSPAQDLADTTALGLTVIAVFVGVLTFIVWAATTHTYTIALERLVTVLVIACPHALGLAIPLVIVSVTAIAARAGLLMSNRHAFEDMRLIDMVVFDKTGTLTYGNLVVTDIYSLGIRSVDEILGLAAAVEQYAQHGISRAILAKAQQRAISLAPAHEGKTVPGKGARARIGTTWVFSGNKHIVPHQLLLEPAVTLAEKLMAEGKTVIFVGTEHAIEGIIAASDAIRPESYEACAILKKRGMRLALITGDNWHTATTVAHMLGIDTILAEVLPQDKARTIQALQEQGLTVAMVGDGINDAPALAQADVGIAIGAGTDIAISAADIILVRNNPRDIITLIDLAQQAHRKIVQNIGWAVSYNSIALPLAAGILYPYGITITPAFGAFLMSLSTIIVALNSRRITLNSRKI